MRFHPWIAARFLQFFILGSVLTSKSLSTEPKMEAKRPSAFDYSAENIVASNPFWIDDSCSRYCGAYFVNAEVIFLHLDKARSAQLVLNQNTNETLLSTRNLGFDMEPGLRITLGYSISNKSALEASYFGMHEWSTTATINGENDLRIPGDLGLGSDDFFGADQMTGTYRAEIHNTELNFYQRIGRYFEVLAGFRYLQFSEDFNLHAVDADAQESDYTIFGDNRLYGGQIGGRWRWQGCTCGLEATIKAGVFGNKTQQSTFVGDLNNTFVVRDVVSDGGSLAFVGEVGVGATIHVSDSIYLRGGYNLIWMNGISRAPNQLDFTDTASSGSDLSEHGSAFLHGVHAGIEFRW